MKDLIMLAVLIGDVLPLIVCGRAPTAAPSGTIAPASGTPSTTTTASSGVVTTLESADR